MYRKGRERERERERREGGKGREGERKGREGGSCPPTQHNITQWGTGFTSYFKKY